MTSENLPIFEKADSIRGQLFHYFKKTDVNFLSPIFGGLSPIILDLSPIIRALSPIF